MSSKIDFQSSSRSQHIGLILKKVRNQYYQDNINLTKDKAFVNFQTMPDLNIYSVHCLR